MSPIKIFLFMIIGVFIISYSLNIKYDLIYRKETINGFCKDNKNLELKRKGFLSDKYLVKKYIEENLPEIKVPKTLFITKNPEELKNFSFPKDFVLKCTSGSQMNIIVRDGNFNINDLIKKSKNFMSRNYSDYQYRKIPFLNLKEKHYDYCNKAIMIEEYLGDSITDYKFSIIKGNLAFFQVNTDRFGNHKRNFYDENSKELPNIYLKENFSDKVNIKQDIKNLIENTAKKFYKKENFDFFRFDASIIGDDVYFGEITFTPHNCCEKFNNNFDKKIYKKYINV